MRGGYRAIGDQGAPKKEEEEEEERRKEGPFIPKSGFLRRRRPNAESHGEMGWGCGGDWLGDETCILNVTIKNFIVDPHELGTRVARYVRVGK